MSKHYLVGMKLADLKKWWPDLLKQLEDEPPMCADPLTPLSAIAPPDETTVRVLYYRSTNTAAGLRIGHAQKSEPLTPDWSFAYRYLERRGKTVVAYRGAVKLAFRSIQKIRADSSLYYIFVQFQQLSSNDRNLEMIDIDVAPPHGRIHMFQDDWMNPGMLMTRRNYQGYVGLCVESVQMRSTESWDDPSSWETDEPIEIGGPSEYHSLWDTPICCNTVANIKDGKVFDSDGNIIGDEHLKGAAWDAPAPPWGTRFRGGFASSGDLMMQQHHAAQSQQAPNLAISSHSAIDDDGRYGIHSHSHHHHHHHHSAAAAAAAVHHHHGGIHHHGHSSGYDGGFM